MTETVNDVDKLDVCPVERRKSLPFNIKAEYICDRVVSEVSIYRSYLNSNSAVKDWIKTQRNNEYIMLLVNGSPVWEEANLPLDRSSFIINLIQSSLRERNRRRDDYELEKRELKSRQKHAA